MAKYNLDFHKIATECLDPRLKVIRNTEENLAKYRSSRIGMIRSTYNEALTFHQSLLRIQRYRKNGAKHRLQPKKNERSVTLYPGWLGQNDYLGPLGEEFDWPTRTHPDFDQLRPIARLATDSSKYKTLIEENNDTIGCSHSRGVLKAILSLLPLQEEGKGNDDKLIANISIMGITQGVRKEVAGIIHSLPLTIKEMHPKSKYAKAWQQLTPPNRAKFINFNNRHGDALTSIENGAMPGGLTITPHSHLHPHYGHLQAPVDSSTLIYQGVADFINAIIKEIEA